MVRFHYWMVVGADFDMRIARKFVIDPHGSLKKTA
jgi:hypothetical protein